MEVNAQLIKQHRTNKALTQQHLADACDISLRTIQRVERYGVASSETLMSLAAVFEVETQTLQATNNQVETVEPKGIQLQHIIVAGTGLFSSLAGSLVTYFIMK